MKVKRKTSQNRSGQSKVSPGKLKSNTEKEKVSDLKMDLRLSGQEEKFLEELIKKILQKLNHSDYQPTVSDAIKAIQLKQKLNKTSEVERIFWELIDKIRKEELGKIDSDSQGDQDES